MQVVSNLPPQTKRMNAPMHLCTCGLPLISLWIDFLAIGVSLSCHWGLTSSLLGTDSLAIGD